MSAAAYLLISIFSHLKWALNLLLSFSLLPKYKSFCEDCHISGLSSSDDDDSTDCAICLSKIDDDEEITDLRCNHMFHQVCLDRWIGHRRLTCPLCRSSLVQQQQVPKVAGEAQVLSFKYCDFSSGGDRDKWWLR